MLKVRTGAAEDFCISAATSEESTPPESSVPSGTSDISRILTASVSKVSSSAIASPGTEAVGKRLGFILQEMVREANTTGSKANDAAMQQDVVLIKEELERMREQVENLE